MDPRIMLTAFRVEHSHGDGTWGEMTEQRRPHDAAELDPERSWGIRRIFRCSTCDESVSVVTDAPDTEPPNR